MTLALDHIQIAIPAGGEDAARAFWCAGLGLAEIAKPDALKARGGLWLALNGAELHLGVEPDFTPARKAHPGFAVIDIDTVAGSLPKTPLATGWNSWKGTDTWPRHSRRKAT